MNFALIVDDCKVGSYMVRDKKAYKLSDPNIPYQFHHSVSNECFIGFWAYPFVFNGCFINWKEWSELPDLDLDVIFVAIEKRFNRGLWPWVFLVTGAFVVSTNHVLGRYIGGEIPPIGLAFWRVTVGALVLLPFAWRDILEQRFVILKEWKLFFLMAILFMPMGNAMVYLGYNFSTALNGGIIATSQPATTVFLAWLILNHNINRKQILGVIIAAFGVLIILSEGDLFALSSLTFNKGDLMLIVATTSFSFYNILYHAPLPGPIPDTTPIRSEITCLEYTG